MRDKVKVTTIRKLGANMSKCGCLWRRDPRYGDVLVAACEVHR